MADFPGQELVTQNPNQASQAPGPGQPLTFIGPDNGRHDTALGEELAGPPEPHPPYIENISPSPGTTILPSTTIIFDVVDDRALGFAEVQVDQIQREVVHDGSVFVYPYLGSVKVVISPRRWQFQIVRLGGWRVSPQFRVRALDQFFNEAS